MPTNPAQCQTPRPAIASIRQLKAEINISNDDLREVMLAFLGKLTLTDLKYALLTMEYEYDKRRYMDREAA